jgi:hypothetical protein
MGLGNNNGFVSPEQSSVPMGTPAELRAAGYNPAAVPSCAVPAPEQGIKGCMYAVKCSRLFGKKGLRFGGFGPPSDAPGTPGEGHEIVPYSIRFADGGEKEDSTYCHAFMATLYNRMLAARDPDFPSGEEIKLLGKAGEVDIVVYETLPVEPKLCNKTRNYTMHTEEKVVRVEKALRLSQMDPRAKSRRASIVADDMEYLAGLAGESKAADVTAAAVAEESPPQPAPIRRRSSREHTEG